MRISYNWLRELLPNLSASAREVAERLTAVGLELESLEEFGAGLEDLRIAVVHQVEPHPSRERLQLVTVSVGEQTQTVVCGASNVPAAGGLVVLAPLGCYLPAVDLKLEPRKIGGILSEGMLCSETELGLGVGSEGILVFEPGRFKPGTPFLEAFSDARDTVFEVGVTPNRPDALGHLGVARDLAAAYAIDFVPKVPTRPEQHSAGSVTNYVSVDNQAPARCPRYGASVVLNVQTAPSPEWLRWRLSRLGVRPISNVVDVTNWVLLEYGNPMHAFDLDRVGGNRVIIRQATPGETINTLDGASHELRADDLVIADAQQPSALAGIMGGANSEISERTTRVLLECAYFEPTGVRRSARRLGLHTDSSYRFERGVGYAHLSQVLDRAAGLLAELASGQIAQGQIFAEGEVPATRSVKLRHARMNQLLGTPVPWKRACDILQRLGFNQTKSDALEAEFSVPSFRPDVTLEADLIEEVARIIGLHEIPTRLPAIAPQPPSHAARLQRSVRHTAAQLGLSEAVTYSFVSEADLKRVRALAPWVRLQNPLSEERNVMTTSLLPGLLEVVKRARRRGEPNLQVFTVASRFLAPLSALPMGEAQAARPRAAEDLGSLPEERLSFAAVLAGERPSYLSRASELDVFDAKGVAVELVERLTGFAASVALAGQSDALPHLHPRGAALLSVNGIVLGSLGPLHPEVEAELDLEGTVQVIELDLVKLETVGKRQAKYQPIPRLPSVTRDIAVEASEDLAAGTLLDTIRTNAGELCESVQLFDVFRGKEMPEGQRSLAFRVVYRAPNAATEPDKAKTLTDKEVDAQHQRVVQAVEKLGVSLRA